MQKSIGGVKRSVSLPGSLVTLIDNFIDGEKCHSNRADFLLAALRHYYEYTIMSREHSEVKTKEIFSRILRHGSDEWNSTLYQIYLQDSTPVQVRIPVGFDERLKDLCDELANDAIERQKKLSSNQLFRLFAFYSVVEYIGYVSQIYPDDYHPFAKELASIVAQWHKAIEWADRLND